MNGNFSKYCFSRLHLDAYIGISKTTSITICNYLFSKIAWYNRCSRAIIVIILIPLFKSFLISVMNYPIKIKTTILSGEFRSNGLRLNKKKKKKESSRNCPGLNELNELNKRTRLLKPYVSTYLHTHKKMNAIKKKRKEKSASRARKHSLINAICQITDNKSLVINFKRVQRTGHGHKT